MFKKFASYYKPHMGLFILDMSCAIIVAGADLIFPIFTRSVLENFIPDNNFRMVLVFGAVLLGIYLLRMACSYIINYLGHVMGARIENDMRADLFKKYQVLDYQFFDDHKTGELMSNMTNHLRDISEMSHHVPEDILVSVLLFCGSFIILCLINPLLTFILFAIILVQVFFSIYRRKKMLQAFRETRTQHGELNSQLESSLGGIRLTKAFCNEEFETKKFEKYNEDFKESWRGAYKQLGIFVSGNEFLLGLVNLTLLVVGGFFVFRAYITITDLFVYFLYINFLTRPIARLIASMQQIQQGMSGFERFYQVLQIDPLIKNNPNAILLNEPRGEIVFENVTFRYNKDFDDVLTAFNLKIESGQKIAIIGETGVGKTTIAKLLSRFYPLNEGHILIDGVDIANYDLYSLRNAIGQIQQDVYIFYGTIKENILYGKPDATDEEVIEAAKKANIHHFIESLDHGYSTITGERGVKLSGGQKQRIAIARLFLKSPKILILDEATSALDNETERIIQNAFDNLSADKTIIVIAHRLSTIKNCDKIVVLGKDGIIEAGSHEELLQKEGVYKNLLSI
ncbi:MAG: ABC transporter ATP-binding protein/permease [Erysipelotrichales bacterium]|nr:ABC transporter ATP-binding protein/permease [Erysipelotrichales bacterium]